MADDEEILSFDSLLEICGLSPAHEELTPELLDDLRSVRALIGRKRTLAGSRIEHALPLLTSALCQVSANRLEYLPSKNGERTTQSDTWVNRETVEPTLIQIAGMMWGDAKPSDVAFFIELAIPECLKLGFLKQSQYDVWRPGMESGTGQKYAWAATPYGTKKARALAQSLGRVSNGIKENEKGKATQDLASKTVAACEASCYLYACTSATPALTTKNVFHIAPSAPVAETLCALFETEYANTNGHQRLYFFSRPVSSVDPQTQILLAEALDTLCMHDDPDPTIYSPMPSRDLILRAEYGRRADSWERHIKSHPDSKLLRPASVTTDVLDQPQQGNALDDLQRNVEEHRLTFLFLARPRRRTPRGDSYTWETLDRGELPDERIPVEDIDDKGEFLFKYQRVLERFAQSAVSKFGPATGAKATTFENGQYVEIPGANLPVWSVDERGCDILEQSSNAMLQACKKLAREDVGRRYQHLIKKTRDALYGEGQSRWYSSVLVEWAYLARLDALIVMIKAAEIDLLEQSQTSQIEHGESVSPPQKPSQRDEPTGYTGTRGATNTRGTSRDPLAVWGSAETMKAIALTLFGNCVLMRAGKSNEYDDRKKMNADVKLAKQHGYVVASVARELSLDAGPLLRILREDRLWEYPNEEGDSAVLKAAADVAERVAIEARIWCAEAGINPEAEIEYHRKHSDGAQQQFETASAVADAATPDEEDKKRQKFEEEINAILKDGNIPRMDPLQRRTGGQGLLLLLAQTYYQLLENAIVMATWCTSLDLELNHAYLWTVQSLTNLLANDEDLKDFPVAFKPILADLYPSTIHDLEWEDMMAPEAEGFLSAVQQYVIAKGFIQPEKGSEAWNLIEFFRTGINEALKVGNAYYIRMRDHAKRITGKMAAEPDVAKAQNDAGAGQRTQPDVKPFKDPKACVSTPPVPPPVKLETPQSLQIGRRGEPCFVLGKKKKPLTNAQYDILVALQRSGEAGMKIDQLKHIRPGAIATLERLAMNDPDWKQIILMAGQTNGGYRIRQ